MGDDDPSIGEFRNSDDLAGKTLSHFEILELLERGPAGSVYLARDSRLERKVTLRLLPDHSFPDAESKERFIRNAKTTSSLEHPHIGTIHDIDATGDGQVLVAMAYYPGETLREKMGRGPLPLQRVLDYAVQLASALDEVHRNGLLHRGIDPARIILGDDGILRLVDLGLSELSTTGGSIASMSPEQVRGDPVDERSDIWSLGVVLFEMLVGHPPFPGKDNEALVRTILERDPWEDSGTKPPTGKIAASLKRIITQCLSTYAIKRYQKTGDVLKALRQLRDRQRQRRLATLFAWNTAVVGVVVIISLLGYAFIIQEPEPSSRFEVVDDPFGLGQGKVLMLDPGKVDTSINRLIADLKLPDTAHIHAVEGPHRLATVYLKIGRPTMYGKPGEVNVTWGLAAKAERRHPEIFMHSEYSVLARYAISGEMEYRDDDHYKFMYPFPFDTDTYYETWFVIDHANNTYDFYIRGGSQFPEITRIATAAKYRTKTLHSLDHLLLITGTDSLNIKPGGKDPVYFDDFYMYPDGVNLDSPDGDWILLDNFESGRTGNWEVRRTTTGPMPKRTRLPVDYF